MKCMFNPELSVCTSWCRIICMKDAVVPCLSLSPCALVNRNFSRSLSFPPDDFL